jgi:hypothetical protein
MNYIASMVLVVTVLQWMLDVELEQVHRILRCPLVLRAVLPDWPTKIDQTGSCEFLRCCLPPLS